MPNEDGDGLKQRPRKLVMKHMQNEHSALDFRCWPLRYVVSYAVPSGQSVRSTVRSVCT